MAFLTTSLLLLQLQAVGPHTPFDRSSAFADEDCNGNGIADRFDILGGASADCQGDGIPDECQVATAFRYAWADEPGIFGGVGDVHDHLCWLLSFTVEAGHETVTEVEVAWGVANPGSPATLVIWSDPNGDGEPADAQVLESVPVTSSFEFTGTYVTVDVPDTFVGPAGTSFFVGLYGEYDQTQGLFPAGMDFSSSDQTSWWIAADTPIQPNDLMAGAVEYGLIGSLCGCDGDWAIRAVSCPTGHCGESADVNANEVPDECDPDCNANGVPDDYEIQEGQVTDCDQNGVPDVCQALPDCDGNGLADLCQALTPQGLSAEYYPNVDLSGPPIARIDPNVSFDFDASPPLPPPFPTDNFSVRWTGSVTTLGAGTYTFGATHDDGVRLWVNGILVIDEWHPSAGQLDTGTIDLAGGTEYYLRLEYYEGVAQAAVGLQWQPPGGTLAVMAPSELRPIYDRNDDGIPDTCQVTDCNGNGIEDAEDISFGTSPDCDGNLVPDECQPCEDCDGNGLLDSCELALPPGVTGQYFHVSTPGTRVFLDPIRTRVDPNVDFDWGTGSPAPGVPENDFGIRWTGTLTTPPASGSYGFHLQSDDGVRLWLDGVLLIDQWQTSSGTHNATTTLAGSTDHLFELEYFEAGGDARCILQWTVPGGSPVVIPTGAFRPDTDLDLDTVPDLCIEDCNLNGVPDPLEPDLNGNCIPDGCEGGTGYWRFEERSGLTALDSTTNGLDGALGGAAPPVRVFDVPVSAVPRTGAPNLKALDMGSSGVVTVPDTTGALGNPGTSFTLEGWVKLQFLSDASGVSQRRWLFMKKAPATADSFLEYGVLVQAGDLGTTGRELAFRYGDGAGVQGITSSLSIDDLDWHFVSVAYDAVHRELRFGVDGIFQGVLLDELALSGSGPLTIGAHENASGTRNQWLFGLVDELRFTRAFLPPEALLDAP